MKTKQQNQEVSNDIYLENRRYLGETHNLRVACSRFKVIPSPSGYQCLSKDGSQAVDYDKNPREVPSAIWSLHSKHIQRLDRKGLQPTPLGPREVTLCEIYTLDPETQAKTIISSACAILNPIDSPNGRIGRKVAFLAATENLDTSLRKDIRRHAPFRLGT